MLSGDQSQSSQSIKKTNKIRSQQVATDTSIPLKTNALQNSNLPAEVKILMKAAQTMKRDLLQKIELQSDKQTILESLRSYVNHISESSQTLMDKGNLKPAQQILKGCEKCLRLKLPQELTYNEGFLFVVHNSQAQLANRLGDVQLSIKHLELALESSFDPRIQNKYELPIAETYHNVANAYSFLGKFELALQYAEKAGIYATQQCQRLQNASQNTKVEAERLKLLEQYNCQLNLQIMSIHSKGLNFEKLNKYKKSISEFTKGQQLIKQLFGMEHQLYALFGSALEEVRVKSQQIQPSTEIKKKIKKTTSPPNNHSESNVNIKDKISSKKRSSNNTKLNDDLPLKKAIDRPQSAKSQRITKVQEKLKPDKYPYNVQQTARSIIESTLKHDSSLLESIGFRDSAIQKMRKQRLKHQNENQRMSQFNDNNNLLTRASSVQSDLFRQKLKIKKRTRILPDIPKAPIPQSTGMSVNLNVNNNQPYSPQQQNQSYNPAISEKIQNGNQSYQSLDELMHKKQLNSIRQMQSEHKNILELVIDRQPSQQLSENQSYSYFNNQIGQQQSQFDGNENRFQRSFYPNNVLAPQYSPFAPQNQSLYSYPPQNYMFNYNFNHPAQQLPPLYNGRQTLKSLSSNSQSYEDQNSQSNDNSQSSRRKSNKEITSNSSSRSSSSDNQNLSDSKEQKGKQQVQQIQSYRANHEIKRTTYHYDDISSEDEEEFNNRIEDNNKKNDDQVNFVNLSQNSLVPTIIKIKSEERLNNQMSTPLKSTKQNEAIKVYDKNQSQSKNYEQNPLLDSLKSLKSQFDSSVKSFDSFHAPIQIQKPSQQDLNSAAVVIQKNFKRYQVKQTLKNKKKNLVQSVLFRSVFNSKAITCLQMISEGSLKSLKFQMKGQKTISVDLTNKNVKLRTDLAQIVKELIKEARDFQEIKAQITSDKGIQILQGKSKLKLSDSNKKQKQNKIGKIEEKIIVSKTIENKLSSPKSDKKSNKAKKESESDRKNQQKSQQVSSPINSEKSRISIEKPPNPFKEISSSSSESDLTSRKSSVLDISYEDPVEKILKSKGVVDKRKQIEERIENIKRKNLVEKIPLDDNIFDIDQQNIGIQLYSGDNKQDWKNNFGIINDFKPPVARLQADLNKDFKYDIFGFDQKDYKLEAKNFDLFNENKRDFKARNIVKIQSQIRGFLARKAYSFLKQKIIFNGKIEKYSTIWFCKLIKFEKQNYSLTVRLASDSHQQMIKKFSYLPFDEKNAQQQISECLLIVIQDDEWRDIDLVDPLNQGKIETSFSAFKKQTANQSMQKNSRSESPTSKNEFLFLDITRQDLVFRVRVFLRKDENYPYQLKVSSLKNPEQEFKTNISAHFETSQGIRGYIWYHLQILMNDGQIQKVVFTDEPVNQLESSKTQSKNLNQSQSKAFEDLNESNSKAKQSFHTHRNIPIPAILPDKKSQNVILQQQISLKQFTISVVLQFNPNEKSVKLSLKNDTTQKVICNEVQLDEDVINASLSVWNKQSMDSLKESVCILVESHANRLRSDLPSDFQQLLFERLNLGKTQSQIVSQSFGDKTILTLGSEDRFNSKQIKIAPNSVFDNSDEEDINSFEADQTKGTKQMKTLIKGIAMGGQMYQFTLDGDVDKKKFIMTLRNQQKKKYVCQNKSMKTNYFDFMDKNEALEKLNKKIVDLIKSNGASFDLESGKLPDCLSIINLN